MSEYKIGIKEAISYGWNVMKTNLGYFIGVLLVAVLVNVGLNSIPEIFTEQNAVTGAITLLISLIAVVVGAIIEIGFIKIALKLIDNVKAKVNDLFVHYKYFIKYLIGSVLYGLIVLGGFLLLIVPGIIWTLQFQFYSCLIIDKGMGPIEALKKSSEITKGYKWQLFLLAIALVGINILGMLVFFVGLFATVPTSLIGYIYVYRKLVNRVEAPATNG